MIKNDRRQASKPVVVAKDNFKKQTETKGFPLQNKESKVISTYLKRVIRTIDG